MFSLVLSCKRDKWRALHRKEAPSVICCKISIISEQGGPKEIQNWQHLRIQILTCTSGTRTQLTMQEMWVQSLGWKDPLEEGMATHSSILAQRTPWKEEPGGLQPMGSQTVRHD